MIWIVLGIIVILAILFVSVYNNLVTSRNKVHNAFANIDTQLQRRFDLIPNLVETVKGYAKHEKETLTDVIEARNKFQSATTPEEEMKASGDLNKALSRLMVLTESYPELKANENFLQLQGDLKDCEEKISFARQFYNDTVLSYMNKIEMFPSNIIASMFNFKKADYFEAGEEAKTAPKVSF